MIVGGVNDRDSIDFRCEIGTDFNNIIHLVSL